MVIAQVVSCNDGNCKSDQNTIIICNIILNKSVLHRIMKTTTPRMVMAESMMLLLTITTQARRVYTWKP